MNKSIHIPRTLGHVLVKYWGDEWSKVTGLLSGRATLLLDICLIGLMSIGLLYVGHCLVKLLPGLVTVQLGYCRVGLFSVG